MDVTIYHNPACGTSRNTLALIRAAGIQPTIIEYLKTLQNRDDLMRLMAAMGISPRELLRRKEPIYRELGLDDQVWSDEQLIDAMLQHPILIERPIVVTPHGIRVCRPADTVLGILPKAPSR